MSDMATCPRCGTARPANATWSDVCPACLLETALAFEEEQCPYHVLAPMAEDRGGTVYLAQARTGARGYVALKLYAPQVDAEAAVRRYQRWKPVLDAVQHPHVRALSDVGLTIDRRLYAASEYVVGSTLAMSEIVAALRQPDRIEIAGQLIDAVDAMHAAGLAHLGLAPSRVKFSTTTKAGATPGATAIVLGLGVSLVIDGLEVSRAPDLVALAHLVRVVGVPLPERRYDSAIAMREELPSQ